MANRITVTRSRSAQRRLGLPLSCMRGIEYGQQLGREVDQLGDTFLTFHNHSKRHNGVVGVLARAARQALNAKAALRRSRL